MKHTEETKKMFDEKFDRKHSSITHLGDKKRDCEVCKIQRQTNPKGYYKTFLKEQKCYWNDEMFQDVESFITSRELALIEKIEEWVEGNRKVHGVPRKAVNDYLWGVTDGNNESLSDLLTFLQTLK